MIEIVQNLTVPLMADEYQESNAALVVETRIAWDQYTGMWAEPLSYWIINDGGDVGPKSTRGVGWQPRYWPLAEMIVSTNLPPAMLEIIKHDDPAFESAVAFEDAERSADRAAFERMVL